MLSTEQKDQMIDLLKNSNQTYGRIGKQFGVTRQFVWQIAQIKKIKRPDGIWLEKHRIDRCKICQSILNKADAGEVCTTRQLAMLLGINKQTLGIHLALLRRHQLVPKEFCFFRSDKVVEAVKLYKQNDICARQAGIHSGVANFSGILWRARQRGLLIEKTT